jgi:hypothetical protein
LVLSSHILAVGGGDGGPATPTTPVFTVASHGTRASASTKYHITILNPTPFLSSSPLPPSHPYSSPLARPSVVYRSAILRRHTFEQNGCVHWMSMKNIFSLNLQLRSRGYYQRSGHPSCATHSSRCYSNHTAIAARQKCPPVRNHFYMAS